MGIWTSEDPAEATEHVEAEEILEQPAVHVTLDDEDTDLDGPGTGQFIDIAEPVEA